LQEKQEICSLESRRENLRTKFGAAKLTQKADRKKGKEVRRVKKMNK